MRNSLKVARWEINRNLKNKSFIISLFITPVIFALILTVPTLIGWFKGDPEPIRVFIEDELGIWNESYRNMLDEEHTWEITLDPDNEEAVFEQIGRTENTLYIRLNESAVRTGQIRIYAGDRSDPEVIQQFQILKDPLRQYQLRRLGLSAEAAERVMQGVDLEVIPLSGQDSAQETNNGTVSGTDRMERIVPGVIAGLVLFSVTITGMMIFQSASQEKKEKVAETILSSITPYDLMQGKIYGYFVLGLIQVAVWLIIAIPIVQWRFEIPVWTYMLVPELAILLFYAVAGYLMFAALFTGLGATVEDMNTASNFQGFVFMVPWLPFMMFSPVIGDPNGFIAQVGSYFPLTAPGVMILRLSLISDWRWMEIVATGVILLASIWLLMRMAGKIFKTGILLYGKNATPKEIWKWLWH